MVETTVSWEPVAAPEEIAAVSGKNVIQGILSGETASAPILELLNMSLKSADEVSAVLEARPGRMHFSHTGHLHGMIFAGMMGTATGFAVHFNLEAGERFTAIHQSTHFVGSPQNPEPVLRCVGKVRKWGRKQIVTEAEVRDETEKVIAFGELVFQRY